MAEQLELDFVTLSPVAITRSHPEAKILSWQKFAELAIISPLAIYALGE